MENTLKLHCPGFIGDSVNAVIFSYVSCSSIQEIFYCLFRVMMVDEQAEKIFALLDLPPAPLLHILCFLPHSSLLPVAASCKFLHATVQNSPILWRRLTLSPSLLMSSTATQSFIDVLRKHGSSVRAVKVKDTEEKGMLQQQLLAFLAASCPSLVHISLPRTYSFRSTNQLRLLVNSFPYLRSLIIKWYGYDSGSEGIEQLAKLRSLEHLHLVFDNSRKSQEKLSAVFTALKRLRKVTIVAGNWDDISRPVTAIFMEALVNSNPDLREICTDSWLGGVNVSEKDKVNLKMKGIEFHEEVFISDSDIDSEEESEVEDEEDSDEDSVISPSLNDSSEEESSGEESSEDEAEG